MSKNLAHPLHPVDDDGKGGGWKWWEWHVVLLKSNISVYARCFTGKVCGLVRSTSGTSLGEDKLGARIINTKVVRRACTGLAPDKHSPYHSIISPHSMLLYRFDLFNTSLICPLDPPSLPAALTGYQCSHRQPHRFRQTPKQYWQ